MSSPMSSIASQTRSALSLAASRDFAAIARRDGMLALYRERDNQAGAGEEVWVLLLDAGKLPAMLPVAGRVSVGQATHARQAITIGVPICSDESELVGAARVSPSGGVYGLKARDTFEVPGWAVGRPADSTVRVTVGEQISPLGHATYAVEVTV